MRWLPILGLFALLTGTPPSAKAQPLEAPVLRDNFPEEYRLALRDDDKPPAGLAIFGPEPEECVRFEPEGLRIQLPGTYPRQRQGTGVVTDFGVRGDFEITLGYQILEEPRHRPPGNPTHIQLAVVPEAKSRAARWQRTNQNRAFISREMPRGKQTGQFVSTLTKWRTEPLPKDEWGNEDFKDLETSVTNPQPAPAVEKTGRLRLVRHGPELFFFAADGDADFTLIQRSEFGVADLKHVRVLASTGWNAMTIDVRVTGLVIRAEGFAKPVAKPSLPEVAPGEEAPKSGRWKLMALAIGGPVALLLFVAAIFFLRSREAKSQPASEPAPSVSEPAPTASNPALLVADPPIVFTCSGCQRRLKVKAQLAGGKLKCPGCGAMVTPPQPVRPEETS